MPFKNVLENQPHNGICFKKNCLLVTTYVQDHNIILTAKHTSQARILTS